MLNLELVPTMVRLSLRNHGPGAEWPHQHARVHNMSLSVRLSDIVQCETGTGLPAGYSDKVIGG